MNKNFTGDHRLREKAISKLLAFLNNLDEDTKATKEQIDKLSSYPYRELIKPIVIRDYERGSEAGTLARIYDVPRQVIYRIIKVNEIA